MPIKDLLVSVDRTAPSRQRLEFALAVAQRFSARVTALALVPESYLPPPVDVHIPLEMVRQQLEEADARRIRSWRRRKKPQASVRSRWRPAGSRAGAQLATLFARMAARPISASRPAQRGDARSGGGALAEAAFMDSGRPAMVVPYIGAAPEPRGASSSPGTARAKQRGPCTTPALPAGGGADDGTHRRSAGPRQEVGDPPGADLAAHLARHGVRVEVKTDPWWRTAAGDAIVAQAADEGATCS